MSINSSVSPDLRTALEALIADWTAPHLSNVTKRNCGEQLQALLVSHPPSPPGAGWRDIALHDGGDDEALFWIVEKTSEEAGIEMPSNSIFGGGPSRMVLGPYGSWSSLSKATHWQPKPSPPAEESST